MTHPNRLFAIVLILAALAVTPPASAQSDDAQLLVDKARTTLQAMHDDPAFEPMRALLETAKGVIVIPDMVKAGFIIGGAGGVGVILAHDVAANDWTDPAFISIGAASFGLQIGAEVSELVLVILTANGLNALITNKVLIGAEAGLALGTVGGERETATTSTQLGRDILSFSYSRGLFAGFSVEGSLMVSDQDRNESYYGRRAGTREIIIDRALSHPGAKALRNLLSEFSSTQDVL